MRPIPFEKWEGLGNDFILVDASALSIETARRVAKQWCDRRFGIGADGILLVGNDPESMVVINSDGSRPEMCGNGIRCVAGYLCDHENGIPASIISDAGPRAIRIKRHEAGCIDVEIDMGVPSLDPRAAGIDADANENGTPFALSAREIGPTGYVVSVGNPHWIFLADEPTDVTTFGPDLERDDRFANRTNVEWVTPLGDSHYRVDVWERGSGRTYACGTGATAVAYLLNALGVIAAEEPVRLTLPGGDLRITIEDSGKAWMRGPAKKVFEGTVAVSMP